MSAALCALQEAIQRDPKPYKNLIPSFVSILKQVCVVTQSASATSWLWQLLLVSSGSVLVQVAEHRLPKAFDYHRTPAPFLQVMFPI